MSERYWKEREGDEFFDDYIDVTDEIAALRAELANMGDAVNVVDHNYREAMTALARADERARRAEAEVAALREQECPKAFYCLPESCVDCPRDQQDGQATPDELAHEETYRVGYLDGERAERERIIGILKTVQAIDYKAPIGEQPYMVIGGIIDEIREGRA